MKTYSNHIRPLSIYRIFFMVIFSIFVLSGCTDNSIEEGEKNKTVAHDKEAIVKLTAAQYKMAGIETGKIEQKTLSNVLKVNGVMDVPPQNLVSVSAPLGGFVHNTELLQGMKVKKGQVLAVMEHPDYVQLQQDYLDKKSKLEFLELEFKRQEELNKQNVNSAKVFQQAKSDYESMKVQVKGLEEKLAIIGVNTANFSEKEISRKVKIYSPISGYVSEVNVNIGKFVHPNEVMFEIVDTEHLHAELTVYEKDIVNLKIGQKIRFTLPNEDNKERLAEIYLIGKKIDKDRSVRVHAHLENEDTELLPGMYINALIELNENKVNAVPEETVVMSDGKYFVYHLKEKKGDHDYFEMLEVQKGVTEQGYTEISFIKNIDVANLQLVTKGAFSLLAKMKNTEEEGGHEH
ncbi:MAG: efflux RND transporter periplasmic adaptor subunit [Vicingus serpentipes]|nr:efflux RND transporter periplasmic adaptor subunit [Vicingus serpentipes]